jgi:hypothetical protein
MKKDLLTPLLKSPDFLRFWKVYPRKDGKIDAAKAFDQMARAAPGGAEQIIRAAERYSFKRDPQYQPFAGTWLRRGSWMIEEDTAPVTVIVPNPVSATANSMADFERRFGIGSEPPTIEYQGD